MSLFKTVFLYCACTTVCLRTVASIEFFVSCVGGFATVGRLVVVVTVIRSPPWLLFFFVCEALGVRKFSPWWLAYAVAEMRF